MIEDYPTLVNNEYLIVVNSSGAINELEYIFYSFRNKDKTKTVKIHWYSYPHIGKLIFGRNRFVVVKI